MRQHQPPHALVQDQFKQAVEALLSVVQARAEISDHLVPPAFGGAEGFEQFLLADEVMLLIVTSNASIANRGPILVAEAHDLADVIITDATFAAPIRDQF